MCDSSCEVGWREVPKGPLGNTGSWSQMQLFFFLSHHSFWVVCSDKHHQMPALAPHSVIDSVDLNCSCTLNSKCSIGPVPPFLTPATCHLALSAYFSFPHPNLGFPTFLSVPPRWASESNSLLLHCSLSSLSCFSPAEPNPGPGSSCHHFQRYSPYPIIPKSKVLNDQRLRNAILEKFKYSS